MTQQAPIVGDVFVDQDPRTGGRRLVLVARVNPYGPTKAYWTAKRPESARTTTIREDRLVDPALFRFEDPDA